MTGQRRGVITQLENSKPVQDVLGQKLRVQRTVFMVLVPLGIVGVNFVGILSLYESQTSRGR
jgi:hypothetical protein